MDGTLQTILMIVIMLNTLIWTGISSLILYNLWDYTKNKADFKKLSNTWLNWNPWFG